MTAIKNSKSIYIPKNSKIEYVFDAFQVEQTRTGKQFGFKKINNSIEIWDFFKNQIIKTMNTPFPRSYSCEKYFLMLYYKAMIGQDGIAFRKFLDKNLNDT